MYMYVCIYMCIYVFVYIYIYIYIYICKEIAVSAFRLLQYFQLPDKISRDISRHIYNFLWYFRIVIYLWHYFSEHKTVLCGTLFEKDLCGQCTTRLLSHTIDIFRFFMNKGKEVKFVENIGIRWWSSCGSLHHVIFKCSDVSDDRTTYFAGCLNFGRNVIFFFCFEDQLLGQ
jgi:hypothetical protein